MKVVSQENSYRINGPGRFFERVNAFLQTMDLRGMSPQSARSYAFDLLALFRYLQTLEKTWTKKFTQKDLQTWMFHCQKQNLKARSINRRLACVRVFYRYCFGAHIPHAAGVLYPKGYYKGPRRDSRLGLFFPARRGLLELKIRIPREVIDPLKPAEVDKFLLGIRRYRDLAIVLIMLLCGLRSQEVIGLSFPEIDFQQSQLRVRGKGKKERMIPMPYRLMEVFEKYISFERPADACDRFFVVLQGAKTGQPMTSSGLRSLFRYRRGIKAIPRAKPHQFRHAFASDLARAGVPITTIQRLLGHSDPSTSEIYIQLFMEDIRADYEKAMKRIEERYAALQG